MNGRLAYSDLGDMNFRFGHAGLGPVLVAREAFAIYTGVYGKCIAFGCVVRRNESPFNEISKSSSASWGFWVSKVHRRH